MRISQIENLALQCLLHHIVLVSGNYVCSSAYGRPSYSDCLDLTYKLYDGWPGTEGDDLFHFYSLRNALIPEWITWEPARQRVYIPKFVRKGQ